jgi:hypothetical protein
MLSTNNFFLSSPSTGIQEEDDSCELGKQDLYQLNQWIQVKKSC